MVSFGQVSSEPVVVEPVADDEFVRDADADVIDLDVFFVRFGFEEQRRNLEMLDVLLFEQRFERFMTVSEAA